MNHVALLLIYSNCQVSFYLQISTGIDENAF